MSLAICRPKPNNLYKHETKALDGDVSPAFAIIAMPEITVPIPSNSRLQLRPRPHNQRGQSRSYGLAPKRGHEHRLRSLAPPRAPTAETAAVTWRQPQKQRRKRARPHHRPCTIMRLWVSRLYCKSSRWVFASSSR